MNTHMSEPMFVDFTMLCRVSNLQRRSAVERWLKRLGVRFLLDGKRRPFTTIDELAIAVQGARSHSTTRVRLDVPTKTSPSKKRALLLRKAG